MNSRGILPLLLKMDAGELDLFMFSWNPAYDYAKGKINYGKE